MKNILLIFILLLFSSCSVADKQTGGKTLPHISPPTDSISYAETMNLSQELGDNANTTYYIEDISNDTVLINQMYEVTSQVGQLCDNTNIIMTYSLTGHAIMQTYNLTDLNLSVLRGKIFNDKLLLSGLYREQTPEWNYTWFIIEISNNGIKVLAEGVVPNNGDSPQFIEKDGIVYIYNYDLNNTDKNGIYSYSGDEFKIAFPTNDQITYAGFSFNITNENDVLLRSTGDESPTVVKLKNDKIIQTDVLPLYLRGLSYTDSDYIYSYHDPDNIMHDYIVYHGEKYTVYTTPYIYTCINDNLFYEENTRKLCVISLTSNQDDLISKTIYHDNNLIVRGVFYDNITGNYYFYTDEALCKIDI